MIAHPQMLRTRRTFAVGRILPASVLVQFRATAAWLRNASTVAMIRGDHNAAQARLSEAELLEEEVCDHEARGVCFFDLLNAEYGSEVAR